MSSWSNITDQLSTQEPPIDSVTSGYCPSNCYNMFLFYVIGTAVFKFFNATGRVNGIITGFRCVKPEDKAFAIGLSSTFLSLVAYIPGPIVYGAIIGKQTSPRQSLRVAVRVVSVFPPQIKPASFGGPIAASRATV